jgi:hypothetical protein
MAIDMIVSVFRLMDDETMLIVSILVGTLAAILYNWDFIQKQKRVGVVLTVLALFIPLLCLQGFVLWYEKPLPFANVIACLFGIISFQTVRIVMENQASWLKLLLDAIIKSLSNLIVKIIGKNVANGDGNGDNSK